MLYSEDDYLSLSPMTGALHARRTRRVRDLDDDDGEKGGCDLVM